MGQLIDETFDDEVASQRPHPAPPTGDDGTFLPTKLDARIWQLVRRDDRAFDRIRIHTLEVLRIQPGDDGGAGNLVGPRDGLAGGIEAGSESIAVIRSVPIMLNVGLSGP